MDAVAESGTHKQLLEIGGLYAEMYYNQQRQQSNAPA